MWNIFAMLAQTLFNLTASYLFISITGQLRTIERNAPWLLVSR
jgi:hypothetical protein